MEMYAPQNNSPRAKLIEAVTSTSKQFVVNNASVLPFPPNVLTVGKGDDAEVVLLTNVNHNVLVVERGFDGTTARAWGADTPVYRAIAAYDIRALQNNVADAAERIDKLESGGGTVPEPGEPPDVTELEKELAEVKSSVDDLKEEIEWGTF